MFLSLVNAKLRRNLRRYVFQVFIATLALFVVLLAEQVIAGAAEARAVVVAAIASTAFVLFISPFSSSATTRHAFGGHLIAILVASPMAILVDNNISIEWIAKIPAVFAFYAALCVGVSMFFMAATNTEHPPAAGTTLAIIAHGFDWGLILFIATAVFILLLVQRTLRSRLINLY
jgi:CBS-domain-containing membrane protein